MKRINLIPEESKQMTPKRWLKHYLVKSRSARIAASVVAIFMAVNLWQATAILRYNISIGNAKRSINLMQSKLADTQAAYSRMKLEREGIEKEAKRIEEKLRILAGAEGEKIVWAGTLGMVSRLVPDNLWINKGVFNKDAVVISGTTFDNTIVSGLMAALDASGYFKNTGFNYTQKSKLEDKPVLDFEVVTHIVTEKVSRN